MGFTAGLDGGADVFVDDMFTLCVEHGAAFFGLGVCLGYGWLGHSGLACS